MPSALPALLAALLAAHLASAPVEARRPRVEPFSPALPADSMAAIPAGLYRTPFPGPKAGPGGAAVKVPAFRLDARQVTHGEFLAFVRRRPEWGKSRVKRLFADTAYLAEWAGDTLPPAALLASPVTRVSWYAAKAYCADAGKRLPTTAEWERAVGALPPGMDSAAYAAAILDWYSRPAGPPLRGTDVGSRNAFGVRDLFGRAWEWTSDFNTAGPGGRGEMSAKDASFFCGGAPGSAAPGTDYATFMRFAFRSSLKPDFSLGALGFRCARDSR